MPKVIYIQHIVIGQITTERQKRSQLIALCTDNYFIHLSIQNNTFGVKTQNTK